MANKEILHEIKKIISEIAVICIFKNSNINVTILNKIFKNRAYSLLSTINLIILRKDYLI